MALDLPPLPPGVPDLPRLRDSLKAVLAELRLEGRTDIRLETSSNPRWGDALQARRIGSFSDPKTEVRTFLFLLLPSGTAPAPGITQPEQAFFRRYELEPSPRRLTILRATARSWSLPLTQITVVTRNNQFRPPPSQHTYAAFAVSLAGGRRPGGNIRHWLIPLQAPKGGS